MITPLLRAVFVVVVSSAVLRPVVAADSVWAVSTSLPIRPQREPARAFDGDPNTYFSSGRPARDGDDFLVTFPTAVSLTELTVLTGKPNGENRIVYGVLELSADGTNFTFAAAFTNGEARLEHPVAAVRAARVRVTGASGPVLSIREFTPSTGGPRPPVRFQTRVEADWSHAPECADFARRSSQLVEDWLPRLRQQLASTNEPPPPAVVRLFFLPMDGVAFTTGSDISIAADWVTKKAPQDYGMVIHELTHVVQGYDGGGEGWLTEGIADYVRDFVFEPGARKITVDPDQASYRDGYTTTAAFLDWLVKHKDANLVLQLNAASRERRDIPGRVKELTGQTLDELWREYTASLRSPAKP